ncbi:similar to Kazachstania africana KAFR_0J00100 hypothetical protein [Maudiozyma saulgeensis]|uniref:Arginase n=1 Tax=Maudiozyma saulgeensis TaxID=1789683 RepID=A0A1X7QYV4_9SACH|nr:similar to Kazachstania africana KAFR_0J00100 hypothetical protein [Kazachstania saulgeensis]
MTTTTDTDTIRIVIPDWQGGCLKEYQFGAQLLEWLAPKTDMPTIHIDTAPISTKEIEEDGVSNKSSVLKTINDARTQIEQYNPKKIVTLGGDCLVSLPSFSYLSDTYKNDFGVLWIDTHPDISITGQVNHSHTYPVASLMGYGDKDFSKGIKHKVSGSKIMIAGIHSPLEYEEENIKKFGVQTCSPRQIQNGSQVIIDWIKRENIKHLAIHIDLDVLNELFFHSLYFSRPDVDKSSFDGIAQGKLNISDVISVTNLVNEHTEVVGITIAEYLPWDAINLKHMLEKLPIIGRK